MTIQNWLHMTKHHNHNHKTLLYWRKAKIDICYFIFWVLKHLDRVGWYLYHDIFILLIVSLYQKYKYSFVSLCTTIRVDYLSRYRFQFTIILCISCSTNNNKNGSFFMTDLLHCRSMNFEHNNCKNTDCSITVYISI